MANYDTALYSNKYIFSEWDKYNKYNDKNSLNILKSKGIYKATYVALKEKNHAP